MAVRIIADSTCDHSDRFQTSYPPIPLTITIGDKQYLDGIDITKEEFYDKLVNGKTLPKTSQASPGQFAEVFKQVKKAGDQAIVITVSSKLSGTYQSATIAANGDPDIFVFDSTNATIGSGVLVEYAVQLAEQGLSAEEIIEKLTDARSRLYVIALIDTLEYLRKGGRISGAAAVAGGLLHIKPVVCIEDGEIKILGKARGVKGGRTLLNEKIEEEGGVDYDMPVLLGYSGGGEELLKTYIDSSKDLWENKIDPLDIVSICSVIGTHAGPGAIAAAYFRKK